MDTGISRARTIQEVFAPFGANAKAAEQAYDASHSKGCSHIGFGGFVRYHDVRV